MGRSSPGEGQVGELGRLPNVTVKLSGLVTEADHRAWTVDQIRPYAEVIIGAFGAARTMWGSDWPVCLLAAPYDDVLATAESFVAAMSAPEQDQVFGGTALAWYALEGVQSGPDQSGPASGPALSGGTQSQGA